MILVTGATGTAGSQVVRALVERGLAVRVFARDADKARGLFGDAVELALGDFADPQSVRAALDGVHDVVLSCADDPRRVEWETGAIDAAVAAGVRRIVKLSTIGAEPGAPVAFWDWHGRVEEHLRRSGVPAVILRSSFYMSNVVADQGAVYAPAGDARIAMIDPFDVGAAAAAVLTSEGHDGRTYELTGPAAITYAQAAAALSVPFVDVPAEGAMQAMTEGGVPEFVAGELVKVFALLRQGAVDQVTETVEELTGRPARDFTSFVREKNKALIRRVFEQVIPAGDGTGLSDLMTPDFHDHDPLPGQPDGAAAGEYVVSTMHTAHPDLRLAVDDLVAESDRVTIRWTLRGTNTGPLLGRPPSGQPVELKAIVIFRIADGKIAERWAGWKPGFAPF
jgi:uncharacterized protein YbjT (DUF2867 family)/predicted ester cyclase